MTDEQHQKIFDLLRHYNEDQGDIPKDLDSMYPHFRKVLWQGLSFFPKWKYWKSLGFDTENQTHKIWQIVRERYQELLKDGFNDVQIIRLLENENWLKTKNDHFGATYANGNEILAHKAINFAYNVSKLFPEKVMFLNDNDGWALYCPLLLKDGQAKPDLKEIRKQFKRMEDKKAMFGIGSILNYSENRIRYLNRILELKPGWGDIKQYIRPIDNYEAVNSYIPLPLVKVDLKEGNEEEAIKKFLKAAKEAEKEAKEKGINTGFYNDRDWYPEI